MSQRPTILLVDDNADIRELLKFHLNRSGFTIFEANGAPDALDVVSKCGDISIIISDFHMPIMNGIELARELSRARCQIPFVLMSADERGEFEAQNSQFIKAFLLKPFKIACLKSVVCKWATRSPDVAVAG